MRKLLLFLALIAALAGLAVALGLGDRLGNEAQDGLLDDRPWHPQPPR